MKNDAYEVFEKPFLEVARSLMEQLRQRLIEMGQGPFTEVDLVDHDASRGLGFLEVDQADPQQAFAVELILNDGDELGFQGVGLVLNCSQYPSGQVWAPGNYTPEVGMTDPQEVVERMNTMFDVNSIAQGIVHEWERIMMVRQSDRIKGLRQF